VHRMLQQEAAKQPIPPELAGLSPLEVHLLQQIADRKTSREIAASLDLSARTVENYRTSISGKLKLTGPNALLRYALLRYALSKRLALSWLCLRRFHLRRPSSRRALEPP
jgi:DNA-binding CsgD family transcriptional regulator